MNIFTDIQALTLNALTEMQSEGSLPSEISFANVAVEPPRDTAHGDMATNAAMVLAKPAKMKPRDIAQMLVQRLALEEDFLKVEIAGPGFINIALDPDIWRQQVPARP